MSACAFGCATIALGFYLGFAAEAHASDDSPAFDRPGIAFSPRTLPKGGFAWEQGVPDLEQNGSDGVTDTTYAASTRLRYGVTERWEIQLAVPWIERTDSSQGRHVMSTTGLGDVVAALKVNLTPAARSLSAAVLAAVSFPTAKGDLGLDHEQYSLGATLAWALHDDQAVALYADVDFLDGQTHWTLSPNWSFALTDTVGGYVEAGFQPSTHDESSNEIAGGGLTWMVRPTVQLDAYVLTGLTGASTDLAVGCGVSLFVP